MQMWQAVCLSGRFFVTIGRLRMYRVAADRCEVVVVVLLGRDAMVRGRRGVFSQVVGFGV